MVGTNRGMADHLDHKLHAGWKHFKGEVSGMGHRTVGVPHQDKAWPLLSLMGFDEVFNPFLRTVR